MATVYPGIDDRLAAWIGRQHVYFVGTAPRGGDGHVNVSPKGPMATLRILGPHRIAYCDLIGSGAETAAHLRENGRIVVMLCAFEGPPRIVRLHGRGSVCQIGEPGFADLWARLGFGALAVARDASRAIISVDLERVSDSCGYGVPVMRYEGDRPQQAAWVESRLRTGADAMMDYVARHNVASVDGLSSFEADRLPRHDAHPGS